MAKYRKLPVVIEAVLLVSVDATAKTFVLNETAPAWLTEAMDRPSYKVGAVSISDGYVRIQTPSGMHHASAGDWLICQDAMDIYPCRPEVFSAVYEKVEPSA